MSSQSKSFRRTLKNLVQNHSDGESTCHLRLLTEKVKSVKHVSHICVYLKIITKGTSNNEL